MIVVVLSEKGSFSSEIYLIALSTTGLDVSEKFNSGFALDLMVKDVTIANSLIQDLTIKNPLSKSVSHYLSQSLEELGGNPDHTEVYKVL